MRVTTETELIRYNDNRYDIIILNKKIEDFNKTIDKNKKKSYNLANYYRVKRKVKELALCNNFDYFVTLTVSPEFCRRNDLDLIIKNIRFLLKKYKRKNKDFAFMLIPELHKDKTNYHFHGLMKGINKNEIYKNKNGYFSCFYFDEIGFNSFDKIKDYEKCCSYITKYITKEPQKISSGHSYFHSRGLKFADRYKMINFDISFLKNENNYFENDYMKKITIKNLNDLSTKDIYKLLNICEESEDIYYERRL